MNARTGGAPLRVVAGSGVRHIDDFVDGVATEVKTGDGRLTAFIRRQIAKDRELIDDGDVVKKVVWEFFPSSTGARTGPSPSLIAELKAAGIECVVWLP